MLKGKIMYKCPKCDSTNMKIERCPNGKIECSDCGHILKPHGSEAVIQQYIPEEITILKDYVYFAVDALKIGIENTEELLSDHEERYGRTTRKNRLTAERLEKEISDMKSALGNLR